MTALMTASIAIYLDTEFIIALYLAITPQLAMMIKCFIHQKLQIGTTNSGKNC